MGLLSWLKGLFGSKPAAFVQGERPDIIIHRASGFRFPERIGEFQGVGVNQYDAEGQDVSVGYNHTRFHLTATVYIYPGTSLAEQFESCKNDILQGHASAKFLSEGESEVQGRQGRKALFNTEDQVGEMKLQSVSELHLFVHKGFYVKYRLSYPDAVKDQAPAAIESLFSGLVWAD